MSILIYLIGISMILYSIWLIIITRKLFKKSDYIIENNLNDKELVIVIPCYKEENIIIDTIKHFENNFKNVKIVIITTSKENNNGINPTSNIVDKYIKDTNKRNIYLVNYPKNNGYMADQLNYFLKNIRKFINFENDIDDNNLYIGLYNADSRPNKNTYNEIVYHLNNSNKSVLQQYSYGFLNYDNINFLLKGFAIYQSNFEFKTGILNSQLENNFLYKHVVGHGLIINIDTLKRIDYFNTKFWCEDIYMTMQLKTLGIRINSLNTLEIMETPDKLSKLIKQNSVWFKTTSQYIKIYNDLRRRYGFSMRLFNACFNEFRCAINWLFFPLVILFTLIYPIIYKNLYLFVFSLLYYIIYIFINLIITIKIINKLDNKSYEISFKNFISLFVATIISNVGPLYSLIFNKKEKYKTER